MASGRVAVVNLGCRVNRVESDRIASSIASCGCTLVDEDSAEVVVINTCAVTSEAEAKTRKAVRHALARPLKPWVVATGCVVNLNPDELLSLSHRVVVEPQKRQVASCVASLLENHAPAHAASEEPTESSLTQAKPNVDGSAVSLLAATEFSLGRVRVGVKVQDGCNHRCSYCIVWKARGSERSVPLADVLAEVQTAACAGMPEVVLTGVNLGAYAGIDVTGALVKLDGLLQAILEKTDIPQLRLSSIEPMDVDDAVIDVLAAYVPRVAPFLHLPIQSGCSKTLRAMNRPYTADDLLALAQRLRRAVPDIALSADVIVGFPGESDADFQQTFLLCEALGLSRIHVFRYSRRPGTPAASMQNQVAPEIAQARSEQLRALAKQLAKKDARRRQGNIERVVVEAAGIGTLGSFHRVRIENAGANLTGKLAKLAIMGLDDDGMLHGRVTEICDTPHGRQNNSGHCLM